MKQERRVKYHEPTKIFAIQWVAGASGTSEEPYLIRFKDGREVKSRDFLLAEVKTLET